MRGGNGMMTTGFFPAREYDADICATVIYSIGRRRIDACYAIYTLIQANFRRSDRS
jgi:hypothetical protein